MAYAATLSYQQCDAGYFDDLNNRSYFSCIPCLSGRISAASATVCVNCSIGYYEVESGTQCQGAATGQYVPDEGLSTYSLCPMGKFSDKEVTRLLCV